MDVHKTIAKNVKEYRRMTNQTQKELAEQLKISLSLYQKMEQGNRNFTIEQLVSLCSIFQTGMSELVSGYAFETRELELLSMPEKKRLLGKLLTNLGAGEFSERDVSALINYLNKYERRVLYVSSLIHCHGFKRERIQQELDNAMNEEIAQWEQELNDLHTKLENEIKNNLFTPQELQLLSIKEDIQKKQTELTELDGTIRKTQWDLDRLLKDKENTKNQISVDIKREQNKMEKKKANLEKKYSDMQEELEHKYSDTKEQYKIKIQEVKIKLEECEKDLNAKVAFLKQAEDTTISEQLFLNDFTLSELQRQYETLKRNYDLLEEEHQLTINDNNDFLQREKDLKAEIKEAEDECERIDNLWDEQYKDMVYKKDQEIRNLDLKYQDDLEAARMEIQEHFKEEYYISPYDSAALFCLLRDYRHNSKYNYEWPLPDVDEQDFFREMDANYYCPMRNQF